MNKKLLITAILFVAASALFGQKEYLDGYVISNENDTIYGKIRMQSESESCVNVYVIDSAGNEIKYKSKKALGYKRKDEVFVKKHYSIPGNLTTMKNFMKVIVTGKVILYEVYSTSFQSSGGGGGVSSGRHDYFLEKNGHLQRVQIGGFKNQISKYFADNNELSDKIKNKELVYGDTIKIVQIYNGNYETKD